MQNYVFLIISKSPKLNNMTFNTDMTYQVLKMHLRNPDSLFFMYIQRQMHIIVLIHTTMHFIFRISVHLLTGETIFKIN